MDIILSVKSSNMFVKLKLFTVFFCLFSVIGLTSCSSSDEDVMITSNTKSENLRIDIEVTTTAPVGVSIYATKGSEPDIYRDGKMVGISTYTSDKEIVSKKLATSLTHLGREFHAGYVLSLHGSSKSAKVKVIFKIFKNGKQVNSLIKEHTLSDSSDIVSGNADIFI